jgi:DNA-3-methyladenine glycosylase I
MPLSSIITIGNGERPIATRDLWAALVLDGFQAGRAWRTILFKREAFRAAFKGFDPEKVARFDESDVERLMKDKGIVRPHAKVRAAVSNARAYLDLKSRGEDCSTFVWSLETDPGRS